MPRIDLDIVSMEKLFIEIIDAGEGQDLFLSRSRSGVFSPALVMWLEINRRLEGGISLSKALLSLVEGGGADKVLSLNRNSRAIKANEISVNSGGLCRARQRLKIEKVEKLCQFISDELLRGSKKEVRWYGKRAYLLDGTNFTLARSDLTFAKYAPVTNQHRSSGTSQLVCTCIHDLFTGIALSPAFGPYTGAGAIGETTLGKAMLARLTEPGIVIADAGFGIFSIAWTALKNGHDIFVRVSSKRAGAIRGKRLSNEDFDEQVTWHAGNLNNHPEIPVDAKISGRIIRRTIHRDGYRPLTLMFFTTLQESVEELLELYLQRERIENDIRSLKYTLGLELLSGKTPDVLEKELLLGFAANNLVRAVIATAASKLKIPARKISFSQAAYFIRIFGNKIRDTHSPKQCNALIQRLFTALSQTKLPNRKRRRLEPRKVVRKRQRFPLMKKSRQQERLLAHDKAAAHGHRGYASTVSNIHH